MLSPYSSARDKMVVAPWLSYYGGEKFQLEQSARLPPNADNANNRKRTRAQAWPKHNYTNIFTRICVKNGLTYASKQEYKRVQTKCQRVQVSVDKMQANASKCRQSVSECK